MYIVCIWEAHWNLGILGANPPTIDWYSVRQRVPPPISLNAIAPHRIPIISRTWRIGCQWNPEATSLEYKHVVFRKT
jgi:hypothetical protein